MKLTLIRDTTSDEGTFSIGTLTEGDNKLGFWDFIELPWRDNLPLLSCIPEGVYHASVIDSPHFGRKVYLLSGVPNRDAVEIHPGNWGGDVTKGYWSDVKGCACPGMSRRELVPPRGTKLQKAIVSSSEALDQLMLATNGEDIEVEFRWDEGLP